MSRNRAEAWEALQKRADILRAVAHPVRLCILRGLCEKENCNVGTMQSCLGIPQSTISQHLARLRSAGVVVAQRKGLEVFYSISPQFAALVSAVLAGTPLPAEMEGLGND